MEVDAFHQEPVAVGHDTVLHHHHSDAAVDRCLRGSTAEVSYANVKTPGCDVKHYFSATSVLGQMGAPSVSAIQSLPSAI